MSQNIAVSSAEAISAVIDVARTVFPDVPSGDFGQFIISIDPARECYLLFKSEDVAEKGIDNVDPFARVIVEKFD